jgi:tRNA threonylcarbamoyladenosine modification (KEOPS) complex Cgi121 subunit
MTGSEEDSSMPTKVGKGDVVHALAKGVISEVPLIGAPAAELFSLVVTPPLERRRAEWLNAIYGRLKQLESEVQGFEIQALKDNPLFITTVMHATIAALRNHQKEKLDALQNVVVNSARGVDIEENLQLLFLNMVDELTPLHLRVLKYLDNSRQWLEEHGIKFSMYIGGASSGLEVALPELVGKRDVYDMLVMDLYNRGVLTLDKTTIHVGTSEAGILESHTTELGKKFLRYIEA